MKANRPEMYLNQIKCFKLALVAETSPTNVDLCA